MNDVKDESGLCTLCSFRKGASNKAFRGPKIPKYYGKCVRPGGFCEAFEKKQAEERQAMDLHAK